ncbi:kinase domain protein [Teladorsagia circumcincta]|uniref:mitogen-activated protein kinase kinase n=1 Tax=Teladorsagia circumcincta TaxID=45464 RepID=A0A2G9URP2_TELCI|nr:kinase domain protein [Teladorsagia circumcincta]
MYGVRENFESRFRKWRQLRFGFVDGLCLIPPRRSTSSDTKRYIVTLDLNGPDHAQRELDDIEQRYESVKRNSGILRLKGEVVKANFQDLQFISDIGNGSCGHVSKMSYRGHVMAVKDMVRTSNKEDNKRIIMDLDVISRAEASHHIVLCYGYFISETSVKVCMEVMASCLHTLLRSANRLGIRIAEGYIGKMTVCIVQGLDYLKDHLNVIHRDVKPSNILLDWNGAVKLCDFGISGQLIESRAHTVQAGCPPYMAPERFDPRFNSDYDIRSDVWSVGISLVELATGTYPYSHIDSEFAILAAIVRDPSPTLPVNMNFSVHFHDFIAQCLQKDFKCRPKYKALLNHPFILNSERDQMHDLVVLVQDNVVPEALFEAVQRMLKNAGPVKSLPYHIERSEK